MTNIAVLKNEIQGLTEQKNKLCNDNKAINAKLREYDSVKKNLEKIIEDTVFKQDQEQREINKLVVSHRRSFSLFDLYAYSMMKKLGILQSRDYLNDQEYINQLNLVFSEAEEVKALYQKCNTRYEKLNCICKKIIEENCKHERDRISFF